MVAEEPGLPLSTSFGEIIHLGLPVGEAHTQAGSSHHSGQGGQGGCLLSFLAHPLASPLALPSLSPGIPEPPHSRLTQLKYAFFVEPAWSRVQTE